MKLNPGLSVLALVCILVLSIPLCIIVFVYLIYPAAFRTEEHVI